MSRLLLLTLLLPALQDPLTEADRLAAEAAALAEEGHAARAVDRWIQVVDLRAAVLPAGDPIRVRSRNNLAWALSQADRHQDALAEGQRALEQAALSGDPSPATVAIRRNLAEIAWRGGRRDLARSAAAQAVADSEQVYGKTPMSGELREYAGRLALEEGDWPAAEEHLGWAVGIAEHVFGTSDPQRVAGPLHGLAEALARQGAWDPALMLREHAIRILEQTGLSGSPLWRSHGEARAALLTRLGERGLAGEALPDLLTRGGGAASSADERLVHALRLLDLGRPDRAEVILAGIDRTGEASFDAAVAAARARHAAWTGERDLALQLGLDALARLPESAAAGGGSVRTVREELEILLGALLVQAGRAEEARELLFGCFRARRAALGEHHPAMLPILLPLIEAERASHGASLELIDFLDMSSGALAAMGPEERAAAEDRSWRDRGVGLAAVLRDSWMVIASRREDWRAEAFRQLDALRGLETTSGDAWWWGSGDPGVGAAAGEALAELRLRHRGASLDQARATLSAPDQRLLCLVEGADQVWAWVVGPEPASDRIAPLGPAAPLRRQAQVYLRGLASPGGSAPGGPLSASLLSPLWPALSAASDVLIVADGTLAWLPLESLPAPGSSTPWLMSCRHRYAPSVAVAAAFAASPEAQAGDRSEGAGAGFHLDPGRPFPATPPVHQLGRLLTRFGGPLDAGPAPARAERRPEGERGLATESALKVASAQGGLSGLRFLRVHAATYLDPGVPSATGVALGPEAPSGLPPWAVEDGFLGIPELAGLDVRGAVIWHSFAGTLFDLGQLRPGGLNGLVEAWVRARAAGVILASWTQGGGPASAFDARLQAALRREPPHAALHRTQREWLQQRGTDADPGVWARYRYFGR